MLAYAAVAPGGQLHTESDNLTIFCVGLESLHVFVSTSIAIIFGTIYKVVLTVNGGSLILYV